MSLVVLLALLALILAIVAVFFQNLLGARLIIAAVALVAVAVLLLAGGIRVG